MQLQNKCRVFVSYRCARQESWSWKRNFTPSWSSSIDLQRLWSNGLGTSTVTTKTDIDWLPEKLSLLVMKYCDIWDTMQIWEADSTWKASWEHSTDALKEVYPIDIDYETSPLSGHAVTSMQLPQRFDQTKFSQYRLLEWQWLCTSSEWGIDGNWIYVVEDWT